MKILISNDDGIFAEGILELALNLKNMAQIVVVAPNMERSATGHAITMNTPLRIHKVKLQSSGIIGYSVNGTPADCVKVGMDILLDEKPDLLFSGINHGANLGTDILYSGTVSAAMEGAILGLPSVAISLASYKNADFSYAGEVAARIAKDISEYMLPYGTLLNVNVPNVPKSSIKGMKLTYMGVRKYDENYVRREDPRGNPYYWLAGEAIENYDMENTDINAISQNYVSITPIHYDLTNYNLLNQLRKRM